MAAAKPVDDISLVVVLLDTSPHFWKSVNFSLQQVLGFLNSVLLLNHMNHLVVIGTGYNSCDFVYDSSVMESGNGKKATKQQQSISERISQQLENFMSKDSESPKSQSSLLSASLSMALCYIQRKLRGKFPHPAPRILCLQGSPDASPQYIAVMNAIFSAQRSMVPIDACVLGTQHSAFLQQAAYITGGIYRKPQLPEGLLQYLVMIFGTDLHSRQFLRLTRPTGVDFRASCFCHKKTIDMGYICSVCLSIFCKHTKECSTCGSIFIKKNSSPTSTTTAATFTGQKRKFT